MDIFNNDSEILQIGALTIENQYDSVIIAGDVEIEKTQDGKAQAVALYEFAKNLLAQFDDLDELPATSTPKKSLANIIKNPFA